jgi:RNA polymerase sigma-70 factor, ECF subfamily
MHTNENEKARDLREILGAIFDLHRGRWRRYIAAILRNPADAEDIVQEAVRRMLARDLSFLSEEQARSYLGRAINNAALELYHIKKRERRSRIPVLENTFLPTGLPGPYDHLAEREQAAEKEEWLSRLREGLTRIPLKQLEALRLTIMESQGQSIRDIGMNHGIPYSTLRHRSKQGIRSLRRHLGLPWGSEGQKREARNAPRKPV